MKEIKIKDHIVGENHRCLVMVDAGVNHNNDIKIGYKIIEEAARAGADIVKFQTYKAGQITTKTAPRYWNDKLNDDQGTTQYETFSKVDKMGIEGYKKLKQHCIKHDVIFSSTPFNLPDVDILEEIGMDVYKISSSDLTYEQLIRNVARCNKPIIFSTGCATIGEIEKAIQYSREEGNHDIILQHCILQYPCEDENANLKKMVKIQQIFPEIPVGYSDHTIGTIIPSAAVALGAKIVEKHFTIDNKLPDSPDHKLSANPEDLKEMVDYFNRIESSKGTFINGYYPAEEKAWKFARKSIVSTMDIKKGVQITKEMLTCKRPGTGLYPEMMNMVVGSVAKIDIKEDTVITRECI